MTARCQQCWHEWELSAEEVDEMMGEEGVDEEVEIVACPNCQAVYDSPIGHA